MIIEDTPLKDVKLIKPEIFGDERGYFFESFNQAKFADAGLNLNFVQDNESLSGYGVIRGLHYQLNPHSQGKLVRVVKGAVYDVVVDLRKDSPTFKEWFGIELSSKNRYQLYIPEGFAHGFSVLTIEAIFAYKCTQGYHPLSERGILWCDPQLNIDWKIPFSDQIISTKDKNHPTLSEAEFNF